MDNTASYDGKCNVEKKKGNRTHETFISQPFNFEHRAQFNKETNNPTTSHVGVRDQTLLLPSSPENTNLDDGQFELSLSNLREDIGKELGEMERRLTKTFQTEIKIALSDVYCALCANKLGESIHVNEKVNETEVNEQDSDENLPEECKKVDNSYDNQQDTTEAISVAIKPQNDNDTNIPVKCLNPTYIISDDDTTLSTMKPLKSTLTDNNPTTIINRPIPGTKTTTSVSDRNETNSLRFEVSKSDASITAPKEAWSEEHDRIKSWNDTISVKQSKGQLNDQRINGLPSHKQRVKQLRAVRHKSKFDERECLAKALQVHVQEIVATVVFKDSELPDALIAGGVITEDESSSIRTIVYRKDQIRFLLSLIKGRDLYVLKKFLKYVEKGVGSRDLIDKIMSTFEYNKKANIRGKSCVLCKLSDQVNIKYVTDKLWSIDVIDDGIYNEVVMCTNPTGSQLDLWQQLVYTINNLKEECLSNAYDALCRTLEEKSHYMHLSEAIKNRTEMDPDGKLIHSCGDTHIQVLQRLKLGTRYSCDTMTSHSPCSSTHSSARISQELLNVYNEDTSLQRSSERRKRPTYMDLAKETAILESQYEELSENDTDIKRTFGNNDEDYSLRKGETYSGSESEV